MTQLEPECSDGSDINVAGIEDAVSNILRYIGDPKACSPTVYGNFFWAEGKPCRYPGPVI